MVHDMATLAELCIRISGDTASLSAALGRAEKHSSDFANNVSSKMKMLGGVIMGAAASFGAFELVKGAIGDTQALGDAVNKMRRETGLAADESSRLIFAFEHAGLSSDDASRSFGILAKGLKGVFDEADGVTASTKPIAAILADIGVNAIDASGNIRPLSELIPQLADVFKGMPDGVEKTGLAMQLFGRSGKDMIPVLNQGHEGLKALGDEAAKLGLTFSDKQADDVKKYTLAQRDLGEAIKGLKVKVGMELLPQLTRLSEWLVEHQPDIQKLAKEGIEKIREGFQNAQPYIKQFADYLQTDLLPAVQAIITFFQEHWPEISAVVQTTFEYLKLYIGGPLKEIRDIIAFFTAVIRGDWGGAWDAIKQMFTDQWDTITGYAQLALGIFEGLFGPTLNRIKDTVLTPFKTAFDDIRNAAQWVIDKIGDLIDTLNRIPSPGDILGGFGDLVGKIPGFQAGGMASGLALVGERGPELLALPGGSRVYSNTESRQMVSQSNVGHQGMVNYGRIDVRVDAGDARRDLMRELDRQLRY
jgi:phage-related protein